MLNYCGHNSHSEAQRPSKYSPEVWRADAPAPLEDYGACQGPDGNTSKVQNAAPRLMGIQYSAHGAGMLPITNLFLRAQS